MISKSLFILAHQVGDRNFYPTYKRVVKNQWKSYEELKEEQEKRLRAMINFAYKNVPYYHKLFDDLKLSADDIKIHNTDDKETFRNIVAAFSEMDENVVFPVHPRTEKFLNEYGLYDKLKASVKLIKPLGYLDFLKLMNYAKKLITDSGGIQKEAYIPKVPCITLRENTEWVETVEDGWMECFGWRK